jgi:hypothetical protein
VLALVDQLLQLLELLRFVGEIAALLPVGVEVGIVGLSRDFDDPVDRVVEADRVARVRARLDHRRVVRQAI